MKQVTLTLTAKEALMVVTALGTYQNRIGQHCSWSERKRIPTLQQQAQDEESKTDINDIQAKIEKERRYIARCIADGKECNRLKERIKQEAEITDEKQIVWKEI